MKVILDDYKQEDGGRMPRQRILGLLPATMSICSTCGHYKPLNEFPSMATNIKNNERGVKTICRECAKEKYAKSDKAKQRERMRNFNMMRKYGITREEYRVMFDSQGGVCAICGNAETKVINGQVAELSVDHCHKTNEIRGLLCASCNLGLGCFLDDENIMSKAIEYLKSRK